MKRKSLVNEMVQLHPNIQIPRKEFRVSFSRSPGPGGQNVNKLNTKALIKWNPLAGMLPKAIAHRLLKKFANRINNDGDLVIESHQSRSQNQNIEDAFAKIGSMVTECYDRPKFRIKTKTPKKAHRKRLDGKKRQSQKKENRRLPKDY